MSSSTRPEAPGGSVGPAWTAWEGEATDPALPPNRYEPGGELGRGGMGVVRVAVDAWLDREVALKRPLRGLSDAARARIVREARITARLDHPGIVPVLDFGVDAEGPFYTMPVLAGITLRAALAEPDRSLGALVRVVEAVARAAAFAHDRGIVHRDLKPENVLIGAFGEVRVLDWGVAFDPDEPDAGRVGTAGYQAPEQAAGELVGPPSDVYALGRTLADVLAVRPAPPALLAVVERATRPDPADRYPNGGAFADELERWLDGRRVEAHAYTALELLHQLARAWRGPLLLAAAATVSAGALLAAWATTNGWERDRAVAAELVSRAAVAAADAHLAAALRQSAAAWLVADARPAAEVLAARSLALQDSPEARGVMMAWAGLGRPTRLSRSPAACPGAAPVDGGELCVGDDRVALVRDGVVAWQIGADPARPVRTAISDGHLAVVIHAGNAVTVWRDGGLLATHTFPGWIIEPVGSGLYLRSGHAVARVTAEGALVWSVDLCERIEAAWSDGTEIVAVCPEDLLVQATWSRVRSTVHLGHPPSAVLRDHHGAVVVGTFDGLLLAEANGLAPEDSGVGPVRRLSPWGPLVVVEGEVLTPRLWDAATGVSPGRLPRRGEAFGPLSRVDGAVERWSPPEGAVVARLTRGGGGGLSFLALADDGGAAIGGNASGDVTRWDLTTGASTRVAAGCRNAARTGALLGDVVVASQLGCTPTLFARDWRTGAPDPRIPSMVARRVERFGDTLVMVAYADRAEIVTGDGVTTLRGWFDAAAPAADGVWLLTRADDVGLVVAGALERRLTVPGATDIARAPTGVLVIAGADLALYDPATGAPRWTWRGPATLSAVVSAGRLAAVGDVDGAVWVLDADGVVRATARGHRRLVSDLQVHGTRLYSASWDGTVRRWDLRAALAPVAELTAGVDGWTLSVEEVLSQVMP